MTERQQQRILITGGLGFIGGVVAEKAARAGNELTIVDSLVSNVYSPAYFRLNNSNVEVREQSVSAYLDDCPDPKPFDLVIHAASPVGPAGLIAKTGCIASEIVDATNRVVQWCIRHGTPLVYVSSAEVYGVSGTLSENLAIRVPAENTPRIEYALGKLTSECIVANCRHHGLKAVVVRPFNVVGARQSRAAGFVMPTFIQQALGGKPLTVFESGMQQRAFTSVMDIADFLLNWTSVAIQRDVHVVNVGNPNNAVTVLQLAKKIIRLCGSSSEINFTRGTDIYGPLYSEAQSETKLPDIRVATGLGWRPQYSLEEIIKTTGEFYGLHMDLRGTDARLIIA